MAQGDITQHFSFADITWKIKNISLAMCPLKMTISSDEFQITGLIDTLWRMSLQIAHDDDKVKVHLKMLGPDLEFSSNVRDMKFKVNWMANILDCNGEKPLISEKEFYFKVQDNTEVEVFPLSDMLKDLPHIGLDDLTLRCYIIVYHGERIMPKEDVPSTLVELSNDLLDLPRNKVFPDIDVYVGKMKFYLHREMFRNVKSMADLVEQQIVTEVRLLNYDSYSMDNLFRYAYSGNLNCVLEYPRIRISEDIERLNIPELRGAYPKEKIELESVLKAREFIFSWKIENLELIEEYLNGPELHKEGMGSRWQLSLHPKGKIDCNEYERKYIFLEVSLLESKQQTTDVNIEFCSLDEQDQMIYSRREHKRMIVGDKLDLPFFRRGGLCMKKCLSGKDLKLRITLWIAVGDVSSEIGNVTPPLPCNLDHTLTLTLLGRKMRSIFYSPNNADFILNFGKHQFRLHKFVLARRSTMLKRWLELCKVSNLTVRSYERCFILIFLEFLYTGLVADLETDTNLHMYEFGILFDSRLLINRHKRLISRESVFDVLEYAHNRLPKLKEVALEYLVKSGMDLTKDFRWHRILQHNVSLACDVVEYFKSYPVKK